MCFFPGDGVLAHRPNPQPGGPVYLSLAGCSPCSKNGRRKITQNSIEVDAETKESTRKTEEKLDGRYKEGHERKKA